MASRILALALIALRELRARKGRTALFCASLVVGFLAITAVEGVSTIARQYLVEQAEMKDGRQGSAVVTISATPAGVAAAESLLRFRTSGVARLAVLSETGVKIGERDKASVVGYEATSVRSGPSGCLPGGGPASSRQSFRRSSSTSTSGRGFRSTRMYASAS